MDIKDVLFKEFVRNGYAKSNGKRIWDIAKRKFLYMTPELAKGFLKIRGLGVYKKQIVDREIALINAHAPKLSKLVGKEPFNLLDIFCGDGKKACEFIKTLDDDSRIRYCPTNVNEYLVNLAMKNVKREKYGNVVEYESCICDCHGAELASLIGKLRNSKFKRNVILLLGSVLASYDINDYLFEVSGGMFEGDVLIIGNRLRKIDKPNNIDSYRHEIFDNWLIHLMRGIGFKDSEVEFDARFENSRVDGFYRVKADKKISHQGKVIEFKKGDEILVYKLYKYTLEEVEKFYKMYFSDVKIVMDEDKGYSLVICKK